MTQAGSPDPSNDLVCITSFALTNSFGRSDGWYRSRCQQQLRLVVSLTAHHHGPRDPGDFVGQRDTRDLDRSTAHQPYEPGSLGAVLLRVADHCRGSSDKQPSQIAIALFGNVAKSLLATSRMLLRHQPDPGRKTATR